MPQARFSCQENFLKLRFLALFETQILGTFWNSDSWHFLKLSHVLLKLSIFLLGTGTFQTQHFFLEVSI
jgi:hypothetical protein